MMKSYNTKWFNKWAKKNKISLESLLDGITRAQSKLGSVDLGGNLYKVRIARCGQGRSGGYRTFLVVRQSKRSLYLYGYEKSDIENIDEKQLIDLRKTAQLFLELSNEKLIELVNENELILLEKI